MAGRSELRLKKAEEQYEELKELVEHRAGELEKRIIELRTEYEQKKYNYEKLLQEVYRELNELVSQSEIKLGFTIEKRLKTWDSLERKIRERYKNINSIDKIPDLAGIRIISLFKSDVLRVKDIISSNFNILEEDNTEDRLQVDQFGYGSLHYIITIPSEWTRVPSKKDLLNLKVELQIRTASQHVWAVASHLLQYKAEIDIPQKSRRAINRAAALLETIDYEFGRIQDERVKYLGKKIDPNETLNVVLLHKILIENRIEERLIVEEDLSPLLKDLIHFGLLTVSDLLDLLAVSIDLDSLPEHLYMNGIIRHLLETRYGEVWRKYKASKY